MYIFHQSAAVTYNTCRWYPASSLIAHLPATTAVKCHWSVALYWSDSPKCHYPRAKLVTSYCAIADFKNNNTIHQKKFLGLSHLPAARPQSRTNTPEADPDQAPLSYWQVPGNYRQTEVEIVQVRRLNWLSRSFQESQLDTFRNHRHSEISKPDYPVPSQGKGGLDYLSHLQEPPGVTPGSTVDVGGPCVWKIAETNLADQLKTPPRQESHWELQSSLMWRLRKQTDGGHTTLLSPQRQGQLANREFYTQVQLSSSSSHQRKHWH